MSERKIYSIFMLAGIVFNLVFGHWWLSLEQGIIIRYSGAVCAGFLLGLNVKSWILSIFMFAGVVFNLVFNNWVLSLEQSVDIMIIRYFDGVCSGCLFGYCIGDAFLKFGDGHENASLEIGFGIIGAIIGFIFGGFYGIFCGAGISICIFFIFSGMAGFGGLWG